MTRRAALATMLSPALPGATPHGEQQPALVWRNLANLPKALGGEFTGVASGELLVAGGSYFDTPPWSGGKKQRVDTVYALPAPNGAWRLAGRLPYPIAAGTAITTPHGLLCTGGQLADGSSKDCLLLTLRNGGLAIDRWPELPHTLSMHAAACDGSNVFIAGGQLTAESTSSLRLFWRLALDRMERGWEPLSEFPPAGRILPILVASRRGVFLTSGAELTGVPGPPPGRRFLADAFRFTPGSGWQRVAPPPRAVQGGSGMLYSERLLIFSGNDGEYCA